MRLGILGGTFDPVHAGHVALGEAARDRLRLDRVLFVVAAAHPLKPAPAAPAEDRYAMLRLALRGRPGLEASDLELLRPPPTYTVDTLRELRRVHPAGTELLLILGADALADLPRWKAAAEVRSLATVVACARPGSPPPAGADAILEFDAPEASSTEARRLLAAGHPATGLLDPAVEDYAVARGLYRSAGTADRESFTPERGPR